jgi:aminocarboxymuconate-semialdehyde decarboxylase
MIIDMHSHIFVEGSFERLSEEARRLRPQIVSGTGGKFLFAIDGKTHGPVLRGLFDIESRIRDMDNERIDIQAISPVPFTLFHQVNDETADEICQAQNDAISSTAKEHSDRFAPLACVPLQNVNMATEELERAVKNLGMKGIEIGSNVKGANLDSRELWPFYERVEALDVPMIVHPIDVAGAERLEKYYLSNLIGNPTETSIAIASIILGGVLEDFPHLKICFVHAGGFIPYQIGRIEHGYKVRQETGASIQKSPSEYLKKIYFDTITHDPAALLFLISRMGGSRVLLGTDYPFDMGDRSSVSTLKALPIGPDEKESILGRNAATLLGIE